MLKIIACLRRMFAVDRAYEALGAVMTSAVSDIYIPELHRLAEKAKSQSERENIQALIEEYKPYADPRTPQGRDFAEVAARVIGNTAKRYTSGTVEVEDAVQKIAEDFAGALPRAVETLMKFDPKNGPVKLNHYWARTLNLHAEYVFRELDRKSFQKHKVVMQDEEGEAADPYRNTPSHEQSDLEEFIVDMKDYVHKNIKRFADDAYMADIAIEIFDLWMKLVDRFGLDVDSDKVKPAWEAMRKKKGESSGRTIFYDGWNTMKKAIKAYMVEEKRHSRAAGKTAAERVAFAEFRCRLAKWILGE